MQYQVDTTDRTPENGQKPLLWLFGSFKNAFFVIFEWFSMCDIIAKLLRPFSTIKICNMKSIRPTQLEKLTKDWMDHSKILRVARKKSQKCLPDFSRTCGFRGDFTESLNFHFPPWKETINDLDFRQNPLKVERPWKKGIFEHTFMNN